MKHTQLFTKTSRETPSDEQSVSAQLLERAGYINKEAAGVYTLLPLGLKSVQKIAQIIREEMVAVGGEEVYMPALVPKQNWVRSGRYDNYDDALFKVKGADDKEYVLGPTHEEIITPLAKKFIHSYKDLPKAVFQIQHKFRNELRAKSGVLRTREFLMKDLYSFHADLADLERYYEVQKQAYWKIFERCGIKDQTYIAFASGGSFAKYSHEFQTETEAGEDEIYVCKNCKSGVNKEILEGSLDKLEINYGCPECGKTEYEVKKCIEVGNIFKLRDKFSKPFELTYKDEKGEDKLVEMGCYGIGLPRLLGAIAEVYHDENGLKWPDEVAPYQAYLVEVKSQNSKVKSVAEEIYNKLREAGIEVLYDDRDDISAGEKFADADLLGIPYRLVMSEKTGDKIEFKKRTEEKTELFDLSEVLAELGH